MLNSEDEIVIKPTEKTYAGTLSVILKALSFEDEEWRVGVTESGEIRLYRHGG